MCDAENEFIQPHQPCPKQPDPNGSNMKKKASIKLAFFVFERNYFFILSGTGITVPQFLQVLKSSEP